MGRSTKNLLFQRCTGKALRKKEEARKGTRLDNDAKAGTVNRKEEEDLRMKEVGASHSHHFPKQTIHFVLPWFSFSGIV